MQLCVHIPGREGIHGHVVTGGGKGIPTVVSEDNKESSLVVPLEDEESGVPVGLVEAAQPPVVVNSESFKVSALVVEEESSKFDLVVGDERSGVSEAGEETFRRCGWGCWGLFRCRRGHGTFFRRRSHRGCLRGWGGRRCCRCRWSSLWGGGCLFK